IGDPAEIKAKRVRKKKTDREDARLMLKLLLENRFPRIWVPSPENRDLRQLLWHRHRLVQMRTRIMNQLQAVAMNEGYRWKKKLFSEKGRGLLEKLPLAPWASRRRKELLELLDQLDPKIAELTAAVEQEAKKRPEVLLLMSHPGVGPITGLVYVLVIGTPNRFPCGKQIGSYIGLIPSEDSSAGRATAGTHQRCKATHCCATCWEKHRKQRCVRMRTGGVGMYTWHCVDRKALPRWRWPESSVFGCTGCGETVGIIRSWSSSVRTRESSESGMA